MNANTVKALVVTINYRGPQATIGFLSSLLSHAESRDLQVIVVDNASGDDSVPQIRTAIESHTNLLLIESQLNRGYFWGARFGVEHYRASNGALPDWVIVCNNDVEITDENFFERLFDYDPESVGVIGPRIVALPGKLNQNPFMQQRPGPFTCARIRLANSNFLFAALWHYLSLLKRAFRFRSSLVAQPRDGELREMARPVYAVHGSFIVFSRRYFEAGGYLDEKLFLYGEEISVAEIARSLGLPVVYDPRLCVWHREHAAIGREFSRFSYERNKKAAEYVLTKYLADCCR